MPSYVIYYTQGNTNGPFDIYLSGSSGLTLYASNVPQSNLVTGYLVTFPDGIPSSSIDVFDVSFGCFTDQNVPFPSVTPSVTPSITISPSKTPSITVSPSKTPSVTVTPSVTPSVTPPPSVSRTPSVTPSISVSPGASSTPTPTPSITRTPSPSLPPTYTAYMMGTGFSQAYLACYDFNHSGVMNTIYITTPTPVSYGTVSVGDRVFTLSSGGYAYVIGGNQWYAISSWYPVLTARACQIDNLGYITNITLTNLCS
jgi:hypothetical protein